MESTPQPAGNRAGEGWARNTNVPRSKRVGVLAFVIVLHAALLALFLATRSPLPVQADKPGGFKVISLADDTAATPPPPPSLPSKVLRDLIEVVQLSPSVDVDPSMSVASAGGCTALDAVAKALLSDPAAVAAVLQAPPETRSIAEAIVVWNAGWSVATASAGAPLEAVRENVTATLGSLDEGCLDQPIAGPRLVAIPAGAGTMFLVFGSGEWTWRELTLDIEPTLML